ncbi:hypothetical protein ACFL0E_00655 [Nanoarchaeota archaeon]
MVNWKKLAMILIALTAFFLIFFWQYGEGGAFSGIKKAVDKVTDVVKFGAEETKAEKAKLSTEHEKAVKKLVETIKTMIGSKKTNCFMNYGKLPDLGEQGTVITLEEDETSTEDRITISSGGREVITLSKELDSELKGFKPCVIAGSEEVTTNFVDYFIEGKDLKKPYSKKVKGITLLNTGDNHIEVPELKSTAVNGEPDNLEDNGWIFKDGDGNICFIPTNKIYNHDKDGIDNDYLDENDVDSIPHQIILNRYQQNKRVELCSD